MAGWFRAAGHQRERPLMSESTTPEPEAIDPTAIASLTPNPLTPVAPTRMWSMANPLRTGFLLTLGALGALVIGFAIRDLTTVIIYIVFAIFIALGLQPIIVRLQKLGWSRTWSVVGTMVGLLAVGGGVLGIVIPTVANQLATFISSIPALIRDFRESDLYGLIANESVGAV